MRLATFNVENMFERPKAMNLDTWAEGKAILEDFKRLNELIQEPEYSEGIKTELLEVMKRNKGLVANGESKYMRLRDIRGDFIKRPRNKPAEIVGRRVGAIGLVGLSSSRNPSKKPPLKTRDV